MDGSDIFGKIPDKSGAHLYETKTMCDQENVELEPLITHESKEEHTFIQVLPKEILVMSERISIRHKILGTAIAFPPLSNEVLLQLKASNSRFTQEDFDLLRQLLNEGMFMRLFSLFGVSATAVVIKLLIFAVMVIVIALIDNNPLMWFIPIWFIIIFICLSMSTRIVPMYETVRFTLQSFRQTHTIVVFQVQYFCVGLPCLKIIPYNIQPCQEHVSDLFRKYLCKKYPSIHLKSELWDQEIDRFVCFCLLRLYSINIRWFHSYGMSESVLKRHPVCNGKKCICEIIEDSVELSYPLKLRGSDLLLHSSSNYLMWALGACINKSRIMSDIIAFKYEIHEDFDNKTSTTKAFNL